MRIGARRGRRTTGLAAAVLALGLAGGAAATTSLAVAASDARSTSLALRAANVRAALDTTLERYADTTHDLVAAATTTPAATLAGTVDRIVGERLAGAHQVLIVDAAGRVLAQHEADGSTPPATARLTADPELTGTLQLSRRAGRLVAGPAHVLAADAGLPASQQQSAVELAAPIGGDRFAGWVVLSVRTGDLLDAALRSAGVTGVALSMTETTPAGAVRPVAQWAQGGPPVGGDRQVLDVPRPGPGWQISVRPTTPLISAARAAAAPLAAGGATLFSLVLAALVRLAGTSRDRATDRATEHAAGRAAGHSPVADRAVAEATQAAADAVAIASQAAADAVAAAEQRARTAAEIATAAQERARRAEERQQARETELAGFATTAGECLHAPLHTIAGFTELLLEDTAPGLNAESRGFLDRIGGATRRMLTVVDELLTYATAGDAALKLEPVETSMLALDVIADRLQGPGERPALEVGELPAVTADALLLRQVLDHLVDNALRFVRPGTAPRVSIDAREQDGGWWRIEVADRGIGVPAEQRERIFTPFHRAPAAELYPGNGLGLAVCARVVALHGGEIGVEANPGGGSVFWFTMAGADISAPQPTGPARFTREPGSAAPGCGTPARGD